MNAVFTLSILQGQLKRCAGHLIGRMILIGVVIDKTPAHSREQVPVQLPRQVCPENVPKIAPVKAGVVVVVEIGRASCRERVL